MSLTVSETQNDGAADAHDALAATVLAELTSWNPREFLGAVRRWHGSSLSLVHLNVLTILEAEGAISMSHLADGLDVSVASVTGIVDRMEQRGLVRRRHDLADRRVVLVEPTDAGRGVLGEIDARRREGLAKILRRLTDAQLSGLLAGHRALREARGALLDSATVPDRRVPEPPATSEAGGHPRGT